MLESKWGLRFVALILAIFFFLSVNNVFGNIFNSDDISQKSTKTIQDVPVEAIYNHKDLHATHVPDTVDVNISGPQSKLIKIEDPDDLKVVVDLSGEKAGKYQKKFQVKGLNNSINYNVKPKSANITLEKKITKTMHVEPDVSQSDIADGYQIDNQKFHLKQLK